MPYLYILLRTVLASNESARWSVHRRGKGVTTSARGPGRVDETGAGAGIGPHAREGPALHPLASRTARIAAMTAAVRDGEPLRVPIEVEPRPVRGHERGARCAPGATATPLRDRRYGTTRDQS